MEVKMQQEKRKYVNYIITLVVSVLFCFISAESVKAWDSSLEATIPLVF